MQWSNFKRLANMTWMQQYLFISNGKIPFGVEPDNL